tara:strand:- start:82791 stop:83888 length:1098 start_codon:yes stop_codon:yes gene_type:complete
MKSIPSLCVASVLLIGTGVMTSAASFAPQDPVAVPNTFDAGTPARASEVNENFQALASGLNVNRALVDQNTQVLDELSAGRELVKFVAKSGAPFTSVAQALASITDAAEDRPYRVDVAPGIYDENVALSVPSFVRLAGAGAGTTVIRRAAGDSSQSSNAAVITLEDRAQLCDLSVQNPGSGSPFSICVLGVGLSMATQIDRVECLADGASGGSHFAFLFLDSNVVVRDSIGRAIGATVANAGLQSINLSGQLNNLRIERCRFEADGGNTGVGMESTRTAAEIHDTYLFGSKHAIRAQIAGDTQVQGGTLRSLQEVMSQNGSGTMRLAGTKLSGLNPLGNATGFSYVHCYKVNNAPVVNGFGSSIQ